MGVRVFALDLHADYTCRHAGACCTAGWTIPIEGDEHRRVSEAVASGRLRLPAAPSPARDSGALGAPAGAAAPGAARGSAAFFYPPERPPGAVALLGFASDGACVFLDRAGGNLCAIQRDIGHDSLPASCRQFPRVARTDPRGTFVSLSHYCPTAARMLFREDASLEPVADPPMCAGRSLEGFDATGTYPPLLRPGVLFDLEAYDAWERFVVRTFARHDLTPERALALIAASAERTRAWTPSQGPLLQFVRQATDSQDAGGDDAMAEVDVSGRLFCRIAGTIPTGLATPALPDGLAATDARFVRPAWGDFATPIRHFLAAHAFGAWIAYQGDGLRTTVAALAASLATLRVEANRQAAAAGRMLNDDLLLEAIRAADLLLVHLASRERMARHLSTIERGTGNDLYALFGSSS